LLVIVYDEHGGLYDHVPPPLTVNPDGNDWVNPNDGTAMDPSFDFTRLGVRVPAVLISPFISPGTIDHTVYDHTSAVATALKLLLPKIGDPFLTNRDRQASTFENNLSLDQPRTGPIDLGAGAKSQPPSAAQLALPINDHLKVLVQQAEMMEKTLPAAQQSGIDPSTIKTEQQVADYLAKVNGELLKKN
jgi:hypothetical protein